MERVRDCVDRWAWKLNRLVFSTQSSRVDVINFFFSFSVLRLPFSHTQCEPLLIKSYKIELNICRIQMENFVMSFHLIFIYYYYCGIRVSCVVHVLIVLNVFLFLLSWLRWIILTIWRQNSDGTKFIVLFTRPNWNLKWEKKKKTQLKWID